MSPFLSIPPPSFSLLHPSHPSPPLFISAISSSIYCIWSQKYSPLSLSFLFRYLDQDVCRVVKGDKKKPTALFQIDRTVYSTLPVKPQLWVEQVERRTVNRGSLPPTAVSKLLQKCHIQMLQTHTTKMFDNLHTRIASCAVVCFHILFIFFFIGQSLCDGRLCFGDPHLQHHTTHATVPTTTTPAEVPKFPFTIM